MRTAKGFGIFRCFILLLLLVLLLSFSYVMHSFSLSSNRWLRTEHSERRILLEDFNGTNFTLAGNQSDTDQWIYISKDIYVYSAYWESRIKPSFVRMVGIGLNGKHDVSHIYCALRYDRGEIRVKTVEFNVITENHDQKHTAGFYICRAEEIPSHAALFVRNRPILKWLRVNRIEPNSASDGRLAVCVQSLYGKFPYNNIRIAEFISHYQLLNVTHFTFYNYEADSSVISLLTELMKNGVPIEILKWDLPDEVKNTWVHAQMASVVDCTYRKSHSHEFVLIIDVDEFLIPQYNVTLQNVINDLDYTSGKMWPTYMFRHTFFCLELPDNPSANTSIKLLTLTKTSRQNKIWPQYLRSKSMVRPFLIQVPGIHYTWSTFRDSNDIMKVDPDVVLLHHYRNGITVMECKENIVDMSAVKFGLLIINSEPIKIWQRWAKLL